MPTETVKSQGQPAFAGCPFFVARKLSRREREALRLAALGLTSKGIALQMAIAEVTAKKHLQAAREQLGAANTTHAVARALTLGLIEIDSVTVH